MGYKKILFIILSVTFFIVTYIFAQNSVETYMDFPVYPPEKINEIKLKQSTSFDLPLRHRNEVLKEFEVTEIKEFKSEEEYQRFNSWITSKLKEFDDAKDYINKNALILGWKLLDRKDFYDFCSIQLKYGKFKEKSLRIVTVTLWQVGVYFGEKHVKPVNVKNWGMISYKFEEHPSLPLLFQGFPLCVGISDLNSYKKTETLEALILETPIDWQNIFHTRFIMHLPELYGWEMRYSPFLEDDERLFEKDRKIVRLKVDRWKNKIVSFIFYKPEYTTKINSMYPENIYKKEIVNQGCLIYKGKYIRPPYTIELKDYNVLVNGIVLYSSSKDSEKKRLFSGEMDKPQSPIAHLFNHTIEYFKKNCSYVQYERFGHTECEFKDNELETLLVQIDKIVKSNSSSSLKKEELKKMKIFSGSTDKDLDAILKNWNGIEYQPSP